MENSLAIWKLIKNSKYSRLPQKNARVKQLCTVLIVVASRTKTIFCQRFHCLMVRIQDTLDIIIN